MGQWQLGGKCNIGLVTNVQVVIVPCTTLTARLETHATA